MNSKKQLYKLNKKKNDKIKKKAIKEKNNYILDNSPICDDNYAEQEPLPQNRDDAYGRLRGDIYIDNSIYDYGYFSDKEYFGCAMLLNGFCKDRAEQLFHRVKGRNDEYVKHFILNIGINVETFHVDCGCFICICDKLVEEIILNCAIINRAKILFYSLKFKNKFRRWLWEKVRKPKIESKYNPSNLDNILNNCDNDDDLLYALEAW